MTMVSVAPLRNDEDYENALARIEVIIDAEVGTPESDELDVLSVLVENFEKSAYPIEAPTPIEAIRFRMEQGGLSTRDLEPILGSRSRVSEVLNGSRALSLDMIRALTRHLDIPAESLLGEDEEPRPVARLAKPVEEKLSAWGILRAGEQLGEMLRRALDGAPSLAMLRQTRTDRTNAKTDPAAMQAWCAAALLRSRENTVRGSFDRPALEASMRTIARLSALEDGPSRVEATLSDLGISFVALPHLPGTHLDGAAMLRSDGVPMVAMTLRRDQVDNFWFTLMHELAHVRLHLGNATPAILDDLDIGSSTRIEREADRLAEDTLIPPGLWADFDKGEFTSRRDIEGLAGEAGVSPAIVAARWRMVNRNYLRFSKMLGHRTVRSQMRDWPVAERAI
ncbi:ImmA/IrrE family metallo-endopeptidase [Sphingomonas sp. BK069]|uniref:ImmA/IrrE family metallo-endopeptidase n=1 Tax=Sphingomonas sp. BK069 TaxID=2586979 RepID=UPI00161B4895|nr:ImmA/IrrE family metallo-endopeptidase [Sphingomonas sp. BK069]MBB3348342.1 HTH-type transcriptional regulator/antitoxin HigA [Sphingomonas sp. BK069]